MLTCLYIYCFISSAEIIRFILRKRLLLFKNTVLLYLCVFSLYVFIF